MIWICKGVQMKWCRKSISKKWNRDFINEPRPKMQGGQQQICMRYLLRFIAAVTQDATQDHQNACAWRLQSCIMTSVLLLTVSLKARSLEKCKKLFRYHCWNILWWENYHIHCFQTPKRPVYPNTGVFCTHCKENLKILDAFTMQKKTTLNKTTLNKTNIK